MHSAYASRYLGSRRFLPLALLHFVWRGERNNCRANPFLDPILLHEGKRIRLGAYCRERALWFVRPSKDFDPGFYSRRHMEVAPTVHPFLHFWHRGLDVGHDPSEAFDLSYVVRAVAVFRPDKREYLYERMAGNEGEFPRNEGELLSRQAAFRAGLTFELTKDATAGFKSLVFVQCSGDFEVPYKQNERRFDLLLNVYDTKPVRDDDAADIVVRQGGTKATAIRALLRSAPDLLLRYDAVLFLDDDVELSGPDIGRLFATFASYALDVAQPALTADSACAFAVLKQPQAGTGVRPISAVEIMTPLISRRALVACRDVFDEGVSGWGLDVLLSTRVRERFGETIALIADVVAAHRRPIDLDGGNFYRYLLRYGIEPEHELGRLARRFGIETMPDAVRFVGHDPCDG